MKQLRIWCLVMVIISLFSLMPSKSSAEGGYLWMVDAKRGVNVRSKTKGGKILYNLRKGEIIKVTYEDNLWVGFKLDDGTMGYCFKEYLHIAHAEEIEEWENRKKKGIKITNDDAFGVGTILGACKVYKQPNGRVIGSFEEGEEAYIRQTGKYWYKIIWQDREVGYIQAKYIEFVRPNIPYDGEYKKVVCQNKVSIYESPDFKSTKIDKVQNGDYVIIVDDSDVEFSYVCYTSEGLFGYIPKKYLK